MQPELLDREEARIGEGERCRDADRVVRLEGYGRAADPGRGLHHLGGRVGGDPDVEYEDKQHDDREPSEGPSPPVDPGGPRALAVEWAGHGGSPVTLRLTPALNTYRNRPAASGPPRGEDTEHRLGSLASYVPRQGRGQAAPPFPRIGPSIPLRPPFQFRAGERATARLEPEPAKLQVRVPRPVRNDAVPVLGMPVRSIQVGVRPRHLVRIQPDQPTDP